MDFQTQLAKSTEKKTENRPAMRQRRAKKGAEKSDMKSNPFFEAATTISDPVAQKEKMVELMVQSDPETTAKNAEALNAYTAWMQQQRQDMATRLIEMTDTATFSNMQAVLQDINNGVLDFEERIKPFMEIISAVREIQEEDATTDIIAELREEGVRREEREAHIENLSKEITKLNRDIREWDSTIFIESEKRSFFGFGDIKADSKKKIADAKVDIAAAIKKIEEIKVRIKDLENVQEAETRFSNLSKSKEILAGMLNLSAAEHEEKHQQLIDTARNFVCTTQDRVKDTLGHSVKMDDQINNLSDLSFSLLNNYTVLVEATNDAEKINSDKHVALKGAAEDLGEGDALERIDNERQQRELSKHIKTLNDAKTDSVEVLNDLSISNQRINNMADANSAQIKKTQAIATTGIAGISDNLATALTSINQAAIGQASTAAQQSLRRMNENTIEMSKEQMLNMAKQRNDDNAALIRSLEGLAGFGEVIELANSSTYEAIQENRMLVDDLRTAAEGVQESVREGMQVHSDIITEEVSDK